MHALIALGFFVSCVILLLLFFKYGQKLLKEIMIVVRQIQYYL